VEVRVYDLGGRLVRRMAQQRAVSTGLHAVRWDGRDQQGARVPPGIYYALVRLDADTEGASIARNRVLRAVAVAY